jgi:amino acid permease
MDSPLDGTLLAAPKATGTIRSCASVLVNTIIGIGMLSLPWAVAQCGWVLGLGLFLIAAYFASQSLYLLSVITCDERTTASAATGVSFYSLTQAASPRLAPIVDITIAFKCFGVATSYLQVCKPAIKSLLKACGAEGTTPQIAGLLAVFVAVAIAPVCFRKRVTKTAMGNAVAIFCMLYLAVLLVGASVAVWFGLLPAQGQSQPDIPATSTVPALIKVFPVFIFSFTCHQNIVLVANELQSRTLPRMTSVVVISVGVSVACYLAVIFCGYTTLGANIHTNYLQDLDQMGLGTTGPLRSLVAVGQALLAISVALSYPLQVFPCRRSLMVLFEAARGEPLSRAGEKRFRRFGTTAIMITTFVLAVLLDDLGQTIEVVGFVSSNTICLIMPALVFCMLFSHEKGGLWVLALMQFLLGLTVLFSSLVVRLGGYH